MAPFKGSPLGELPRLRPVRTRRASSWDRTGGNNDFVRIRPGETVVLADIAGAGCINHIWCTHMCAQPAYLRRLVLRMRWDDEPDWSVEVPLGDFFGVGHAQAVTFSSLPLQMSPADGRGFNCFFPMPFGSRAQVELTSECDQDANFYYYIDYELHDSIPDDFGRFHAQWRSQRPTDGIDDTGMDNREFAFGGTNADGAGNYVILDAKGAGHYVGCNLNVHNLRQRAELDWPEGAPWPPSLDGVASATPEQLEQFFQRFNWYGEGDDMICIDGESWPPALHGTGTEDYFNTAYCPTVKFDAPYHGITLPGGPNWSGKVSLYRFHIEDPIHFQESIRVTIEHGHANHRSDDYASTAYWYQREPHAPFPALPPVSARLPLDD